MTEPEAQTCDVLIVGAGINGAGLFRDLCLQGVDCVIVDKGDFGSGTSAAPSRLIHGGLKYLETGEFRLVAESTYERNLLLRNAPHLVHPLPTVIPLFSWIKGAGAAIRTLLGATTAPRSRGAILVKLGLAIYDFYGSRARQMPRHHMTGRRRALRDMPALTPRIVGLGNYHDAAVTAPERLVLELIQDGVTAHPGSAAMNWTAVTARRGDCVTLAGPDGTIRLRPRIVINAAGPWIDRVNAALGLETQLIGGTRGSHILLDHPDLLAQLRGRMIYFEGNDGRILLVYPYLGKVLVGSTDLPDSAPDTAICTPEETAYFIAALRDLLPGLSFDEGQIVYSYAGIRPLPNSKDTAPGLISRDHSTPTLEPDAARPFPVIALVGGKWTTFRAFSAQVADDVLGRLGRQRVQSTADSPIGGGRDMPAAQARPEWIRRVAAQTGAAPERVAELLGRYGTTAAQIAAEEGNAPAALTPQSAYSTAEIAWIARTERVVHLEDIVLRRTQIAITGALDADSLQRIADVAAGVLGWDAARRAEELVACRAILARRHAVTQLRGDADPAGDRDM